MNAKAARLDDAEWLAARRREGWSDKRVAAELSLSAERVRDALRRHGLPKLYRTEFPRLQDDDWMRAQVDAGRSMADIARQLGCSTRSVRDAAARVGRVPTPRPPRRPPPVQLDDPAWLSGQLIRRPIPVIAAELAISSKHVTAAARRYGITIPPGPRIQFPELRDAEWLRSRSHRTIAEVADELGCSTHTVEKAITRTGVRLGQPSATRRGAHRSLTRLPVACVTPGHFIIIDEAGDRSVSETRRLSA